MGKLNKNELIACGGGNIVTTFTSLFISMVNVIKILVLMNYLILQEEDGLF